MSIPAATDPRASSRALWLATVRRARPDCTAVLAVVLAGAIVACGSSGGPSPSPTAVPPSVIGDALGMPTAAPSTSQAPADSVPPSTAPGPSQEPDTGGGTTSGDVPDDAVFLTYRQTGLGFSIQYVEGWQVTTQPDGVVIKDKDSSETVAVVAAPVDGAAYIASTDLPALRSQPGFKLVKQDTVRVGAMALHHLVFHVLSPADPITGKHVPSTVDRYYVPGTDHLAVVSLSTPDGVDNVDAFRQMIASFAWA